MSTNLYFLGRWDQYGWLSTLGSGEELPCPIFLLKKLKQNGWKQDEAEIKCLLALKDHDSIFRSTIFLCVTGWNPVTHRACKNTNLDGYIDDCIFMSYSTIQCSPDCLIELLSKLWVLMFSIKLLNVSSTLVDFTSTLDPLFEFWMQ